MLMTDKRLYKGVFWIKDKESIDESSVSIKALCDINGNFIDLSSINLDTLSKQILTIKKYGMLLIRRLPAINRITIIPVAE